MRLRNFKNTFFDLCSRVQRPAQASWLFVLCSVFIIGCATSEDLGRMQYDINTLRSEIKNIKKKSYNIEAQIPGQKKQLNKKLQRIEETQKATAKTVSDLLIQFQSLTTEFRILTGRFEESRYFSEKNSAEFLESKEMLTAKLKALELAVEDLRKKLAREEKEEKRVKESKKAKEEVKKAKKTEKQKSSKTEREEAAQTNEIKDIYMAAYQTFKKGKMDEAREKFMSVINDYPENEYSDNARFWIGESYYKDGNYEDAILAYEELFRKNPDSNKYPDAMLKQGLAFYALKDKKTGNIILDKLIEKFPDSEQAKLAKKKMKKTVLPKKKK